MECMSHRKQRETKQQPSMLPGPAVPGCCFVSFCFPHSIHSVLKLYNLYGKKIAQFISFVPTTYSPSAMSMHGATRRAFARTRGAISLPFPQFGMSRDRTRNWESEDKKTISSSTTTTKQRVSSHFEAWTSWTDFVASECERPQK